MAFHKQTNIPYVINHTNYKVLVTDSSHQLLNCAASPQYSLVLLPNVKQSSALQEPMCLIIHTLIAASADAFLISAGWLMLSNSSDGSTAQACPGCSMLHKEWYISSEIGNLG